MGISNDDQLYSWALAAIFLLALFSHFYGGTGILGGITALAGLVVAFYLVKGVLFMAAGKSDLPLWTGVVFATILIFMFGGLQAILSGLGLIAAVVTTVLTITAKALTSSFLLLFAVVILFLALKR
ncbi:hypothetical protein HY546_02555 [archaeon]|nr:hypothetical protein [archaeon]